MRAAAPVWFRVGLVLALPRPEQNGKDDSPAEGQNIPRVIRLRARSAPGR